MQQISLRLHFSAARMSNLLFIGYCFDVKQDDFIVDFISDCNGINVPPVFHSESTFDGYATVASCYQWPRYQLGPGRFYNK